MSNIEKFLEQIKIYDCPGMAKIRLGNKGDGGYVALKEICERTDTVYSYGIGDDVGFELDFADRFTGKQINLYDPTITELPCKHPGFAFYRQGIGSEYPMIYPLPGSLLKIDVEWSEWEGIQASISTHDLLNFNQILIELHIVHCEPKNNLSPYFKGFYQSVYDKINEELFFKYYSLLKLLNEYFYIFHAHANNSLPMVTVGGYKFPPLIELSLVRKDLIDNVQEFIGSLPIEGLDYPNKTDRPDIIGYQPIRRKNV
jgi:hypothetical protein